MACDSHTGELFVFPHSGRFQGRDTYSEPVLIGDRFHWQRDYGVVRTIDINGNGHADVIALCDRDVNGRSGVFLFPNRGRLDGLDTLAGPIQISGPRSDRRWETLGIADLDLDGCDDMFGREKDRGEVHGFFNRREVVEHETYSREPVLMVTVDVADWPLGMADFTGSGRPDLLVRRGNGDLDVYEFAPDETGGGVRFGDGGRWFTVARGWQSYDRIVLTDVDLDGHPDLLAIGADGVLLAFQHDGVFDPENPLALFRAPVVVATGWQRFGMIS